MSKYSIAGYASACTGNFDAKIKAQQKESHQIFSDQGRLRENMKALKGSPEEKMLLQRYTKQLDDEETHLDALHRKMQEMQVQREKANEELQKRIGDLQLDAVL